jgi:hypothetical protein
VDRIMWWSSFDNIVASSKKEWIERAVRVWKNKWYTNVNSLITDNKLKDAIAKWNQWKSLDSEKVHLDDFTEEVWKTWEYKVASEPTNKKINWNGTWWSG